MLLMLLEKNMQVDEVIFFDTTMEFQAIYDTRDEIKKLLKEKNIRYTELSSNVPFQEKMYNIKVQKHDGTTQNGYGCCGGICRYGTSDKIRIIESYLHSQYGEKYREYIGIASDEVKRIKKERNIHKLLPLVEWGITEKDCLEYCYKKNFEWKENGIRLYDIFDRVSCWCCADKNKKELDNMLEFLPAYYLKRIKMLKKIKNNNKRGSKVVEQAKNVFMKMF